VAWGHLSGRCFPASGRKGNKADSGAPLQITIRVWLPMNTIPTQQQRTFMTLKNIKPAPRSSPLFSPSPPARCSRFMRTHRPSTNERSTNQHTLPRPHPPSPSYLARSSHRKKAKEITYHVQKDLGYDIWLYKRYPKRSMRIVSVPLVYTYASLAVTTK